MFLNNIFLNILLTRFYYLNVFVFAGLSITEAPH